LPRRRGRDRDRTDTTHCPCFARRRAMPRPQRCAPRSSRCSHQAAVVEAVRAKQEPLPQRENGSIHRSVTIVRPRSAGSRAGHRGIRYGCLRGSGAPRARRRRRVDREAATGFAALEFAR
jgi:hypothetical protein